MQHDNLAPVILRSHQALNAAAESVRGLLMPVVAILDEQQPDGSAVFQPGAVLCSDLSTDVQQALYWHRKWPEMMNETLHSRLTHHVGNASVWVYHTYFDEPDDIVQDLQTRILPETRKKAFAVNAYMTKPDQFDPDEKQYLPGQHLKAARRVLNEMIMRMDDNDQDSGIMHLFQGYQHVLLYADRCEQRFIDSVVAQQPRQKKKVQSSLRDYWAKMDLTA